MKYFIMLFLLTGILKLTFSQKIKVIAAYDNESSYTSGLYAMQDTAVYRYSWYYNEWFSLENFGLTRVNDTVKISSLAVYNNKSNNSSGIFVFSDTVVLNYNWITTTWYPLHNTGLPRINNKPDVRMLAVYGDSGSSSNSTLFALTDTAVYRYNWYYQEWSPLSNAGISNLVKTLPGYNIMDVNAFPNPFENQISVTLNLPVGFNDKIKVAVFNEKGDFIKCFEQNNNSSENLLILNDLCNLSAGFYFCEIKAGEKIRTIKVIKKQ